MYRNGRTVINKTLQIHYKIVFEYVIENVPMMDPLEIW